MAESSEREVEVGKPIRASDIRPGDVLGFQTPTGTSKQRIMIASASSEPVVNLTINGHDFDKQTPVKDKSLVCDKDGNYAGTLVWLTNIDLEVPDF